MVLLLLLLLLLCLLLLLLFGPLEAAQAVHRQLHHQLSVQELLARQLQHANLPLALSTLAISLLHVLFTVVLSKLLPA